MRRSRQLSILVTIIVLCYPSKVGCRLEVEIGCQCGRFKFLGGGKVL